MMVGKVSTNWQVADAQDDDITIVKPISDLNVDAEFEKPITDLLHNFQIFSRRKILNEVVRD